MDAENNPFAALFQNIDLCTQTPKSTSNDSNDDEKYFINSMIEDVFYITINEQPNDRSKQLVYLSELATTVTPNKLFDLEILEQGLFDRLLILQPSLSVIPKNCNQYNENIIESNVIDYLYKAEQNLEVYKNSLLVLEKSVATKMHELIIRNVITALKQPELFEGQILSDQIFKLLKNEEMTCHNFINDIVNDFMDDETSNLQQLNEIFIPVLKLIKKDIMKASLTSIEMYIFPTLSLFSMNVHLAETLLQSCIPPPNSSGYAYQKTVLGGLLCLSVLPKSLIGNYEYFDTPLDEAISSIETNNLNSVTDYLLSNLYKIFLNLLKCNQNIKNNTLQWIGNCLHANADRGKLWNSQFPNQSSIACVSDGFMLNLGTVLLMFSERFCVESKYLKIDPTYCAVEDEDCNRKSIHLKGISKETCIIPLKENDSSPRPTAETYGFITECFFMTQKTLDLGYRIIVEKFVKLTQEINQIRQTFADALHDSSSEIASMLDKRMKKHMTKFMTLRCALKEGNLSSLLPLLHGATCVWLVQLALHSLIKNNDTFAPITSIPLKFPLTDDEPELLRYVPEFVVENIFDYVTTIKHLNLVSLGQDSNLLESILSAVLVFMGNHNKMRNPHLRAKLAECLFALLPYNEQPDIPYNASETFIRERLFKEHPHRAELVPSLLNIFVGIEVTGENIQFEQKFNYRRPMYLVMDYLWEFEEHRNIFKKLSKEAEENIEAVQPPLFLRFINLLINDAVFLLDDALNNMAQIRNLQSINDTELAQRSISEREEHYMNLRYVGMYARFDNILGRHTITTLEHLTSEIKSIFCHPTMVDRVASMLNYFLLHLVGPNQKKFKVRNSKEYEFNPVATVLDICKIYIHLGENKEFCVAVSQDGRSYKPDLFKLAEDVLVRILGGGELISSLQNVAAKITLYAQHQLEEEEIFSDVPEEFLDPIMNTVMLDPVILPSSKVIIDRTTIARHLLSDQSDPFNRSPLTMDKVLPNKELKIKINEWIKEKRKEKFSCG